MYSSWGAFTGHLALFLLQCLINISTETLMSSLLAGNSLELLDASVLLVEVK